MTEWAAEACCPRRSSRSQAAPGRFGLYDEGFVAVLDDLELIKDGLKRRPIPIMKAYIGFPEQLLKLPAEIDTLVKKYGPAWKRLLFMKKWKWMNC